MPGGQIYGGDFPLVDLTVIPDDEIMTHRRMAALELLQKHIRLRDLSELCKPLATLFCSYYTTNKQLDVLINYMIQAGETADPKSFLRELAERLPQHKETLMTITEKLQQESRQEGKQQGKQEVAREMLAKGMDFSVVQEMNGLTADELKQLH